MPAEPPAPRSRPRAASTVTTMSRHSSASSTAAVAYISVAMMYRQAYCRPPSSPSQPEMPTKQRLSIGIHRTVFSNHARRLNLLFRTNIVSPQGYCSTGALSIGSASR